MDILTQFAGSGILGTIGGILGSLGTGILKYKTAKMQNQHDLAMAKLAGDQELAMHKAEVQKITVEGDISRELAAEQTLQASFEHDAKLSDALAGVKLSPAQAWIMVFVESIRRLMRPALTLTSVGYVMYIFSSYWGHLSQLNQLPADAILDQLILVMSAIVALATMAGSWWFGDRSLQKHVASRMFGPA